MGTARRHLLVKLETTILAAAELKDRLLKAVMLVLGENVLRQLLRLASNLMLTRLLVPEMFGVMALANTLVVGAQMFTDAGLHVKLVQSEHAEDERFVNTVWTITILRGLLITGLLLLLTLAIALLAGINWVAAGSVYDDPNLPWVLAALAWLPVLDAFASTRLPLAQRRLDFKGIVRLQLISQVLGIVVMVLIAWLVQSIWALVLGSFAGSLSRVWLSHRSLPGIDNRFLLDKQYAAEIFHFSRWIFLSSSVTFMANNADRLLLGALMVPAMMGQYSIAVFLIEAVRQLISGVANKVALPVFSEVARTDRSQLAGSFYGMRKWFDMLTAIVAGGLFASGQVVINILYDDRYAQAGVYLQLLALSVVVVRYQLTGQLMLAMNKARVMAIAPAVRGLALLVLIPLAAGQAEGDLMIAAVTLAYFAELPAYIWLLARQGILSPIKELVYLPLVVVGYGLGHAFNFIVGSL